MKRINRTKDNKLTSINDQDFIAIKQNKNMKQLSIKERETLFDKYRQNRELFKKDRPNEYKQYANMTDSKEIEEKSSIFELWLFRYVYGELS